MELIFVRMDVCCYQDDALLWVKVMAETDSNY